MKRKLNQVDVPEPIGSANRDVEPLATDAEPLKAESNVGTVNSQPAPNFASLGLDPRLLQAIAREKLSSPTPVQAKAIPVAIRGEDVLARAKTGSGKTFAYLLPLLNRIILRKTTAKTSALTSDLILVPTIELASQVSATLRSLTSAISFPSITQENITRKEDAAVTKSRLASIPDVIVATPSRAAHWINAGALKLEDLACLVVDEADLVLTYGYEEDVRSIAAALVKTRVQIIMMSATLRTEVDSLSALLFNGGKGEDEGGLGKRQPVVLDMSVEEAAEQPTLSQYFVRCAEEEKFLLIYALFKLKLIKGKVIVFVADTDRCYRVKLFLEQFGVRSCVLNSELPVNSRLHAVEEFNRSVYDILIAADEKGVVGDEAGSKALQNEGAGAEEEDGAESRPQKSRLDRLSSKRQKRDDRDYGVSRGIDFQHVTHVLNFDLPTTSKSYAHRIGRTARAGNAGSAISFVVPKSLYRKHKSTSIQQCENDEKILEKIRKKQSEKGSALEEWRFDMSKLEGFRYRFADGLRSVTRIAVREARTKELRQELLNSTRLKQHFEENPDDLRHLRHDIESHAIRQQSHLKHVPEYLLPPGGKTAVTKDVGFVGLRKDKENRIRKAREFNKKRGKGRLAKTKGLDPLKSLNVRGRGK